MDKEDRDKTNRRIDAIHEFGRDPENAEGRTALPPPGTPERDIVQICGFCMMNFGRLNILKIAPCQDWEAVVIYQRGKDLRMFRNGSRLYRSDGICHECYGTEFESVKSESQELIKRITEWAMRTCNSDRDLAVALEGVRSELYKAKGKP